MSISRSFLPSPASSKHDYGIVETSAPNDFWSQPESFLSERLPTRMEFHQGAAEARVPSPFSRAYLFYFGLSKGFLLPPPAQEADADTPEDSGGAVSVARENLRRKARAAFRGICAAHALRDFFRLRFELHQAPSISEEARKKDSSSEVYRMLARSTDNDPHRQFWDQFGYYVLVGADGHTKSAVAGLSPLTGFFPAAKGPSWLQNLYWYDPKKGVWSDPTELGRPDWLALDARIQPAVRTLLTAWLQEVLVRLTKNIRPMRQDLQKRFGMKANDIDYLENEFRDWQGDLLGPGGQRPSLDGIKIREPLSGDQPDQLRIVQAVVSTRDIAPVPFLSLTCQAEADYGFLLSDLPFRGGRVLVTSQDLLNPNCRLYGDRRGAPVFRDRLSTLALEDDNLGAALGLDSNAIPLPYFYLNHLFTPFLTNLSTVGFSDEWTGLVGDGVKGTYLFPLDTRILEFIKPQDLKSLTSLTPITSAKGEKFLKVVLKISNREVTQIYGDPADPAHKVDKFTSPDTFDLRLFPNFDLNLAGNKPSPLLPADDDRVYFARARLSPEWYGDEKVPEDFLQPLAAGRTARYQSEDAGSFLNSDPSQKLYASGMARFFRIFERTDGFFFKDRGLCLLDLPPTPEVEPKTWSVAIDFGTSNTCVAFRNPDSHSEPQVLRLPMMTSSLLRKPNYKAIGSTDEGLSAVLDFFDYAADRTDLYEAEYFPSQLCTTLEQVPQAGHSISVRDGSIVFRNLSEILLENASLTPLINNFSDASLSNSKEWRVRPRFWVRQDIKWSVQVWMRIFLHNLRRYITLAAARQKAEIKKVVFTHPKAFTRTERIQFETLLKDVWKPNLQATPAMSLELQSESEGARSYIAGNRAVDYFVLDIGGGTTDVMAFRFGESFYQSSFRFAADQIDLYLMASPNLRTAIVKSAEASLSIKDTVREQYRKQFEELGFTKPIIDPQSVPDTPTDLMVRCRAVWHGLLQHIMGPDQASSESARRVANFCEYLRNPEAHAEHSAWDESTKRSVQGLFLSILLAYGGLAYFGGLMERELRETADEGRKPDRKEVRNPIVITFIGNGGKYYHFLNDTENSFGLVMEELFKAPMDGTFQTPVQCEGVFTPSPTAPPRPKAAIALGMLLGIPEQNSNKPFVCDRLGEDSFEVGDAHFVGDSRQDLRAFYLAVAEEAKRPDPHLRPGENSTFEKFIGKLDRLLPIGRRGDHVVVPALWLGWANDLFADSRDKFLPLLRSRLVQNVQKYQKGYALAQDEGTSRTALEPVFIAELSAMLSVIREKFAQ